MEDKKQKLLRMQDMLQKLSGQATPEAYEQAQRSQEEAEELRRQEKYMELASKLGALTGSIVGGDATQMVSPEFTGALSDPMAQRAEREMGDVMEGIQAQQTLDDQEAKRLEAEMERREKERAFGLKEREFGLKEKGYGLKERDQQLKEMKGLQDIDIKSKQFKTEQAKSRIEIQKAKQDVVQKEMQIDKLNKEMKSQDKLRDPNSIISAISRRELEMFAGIKLPEETSAEDVYRLQPLMKDRVSNKIKQQEMIVKQNAEQMKQLQKLDEKDMKIVFDQQKQYNADPRVKESKQVLSAYERVIESKPDAAGDLALIFNYMKMLDPGSVVRETEFANAQNAAGIPDRVRNLWNRLLKGERLNPNQRGLFKSQAGGMKDAAMSSIDEVNTEYKNFIKTNNLPEKAFRFVNIRRQGKTGDKTAKRGQEGYIEMTDPNGEKVLVKEEDREKAINSGYKE